MKIDSRNPKGDRGGNKQKVQKKLRINNLHFVWDSVIYKYTESNNLPLSNTDWEWYTREAEDLANSYPVPSDMIKAGSFKDWSLESWDIAIKYGYNHFNYGEALSEDYQAQALPVLE